MNFSDFLPAETTREQAVTITRAYLDKQFPKKCTKCGVVFKTLAEYLKKTRHQGDPISYDAERGDFQPKQPLGIFSFAECVCGTTLTVDSRTMPLFTMWRLMAWARGESKRLGISFSEVVETVRAEIDRRVLSEA